MKPSELQQILELHKKFLNGEKGGLRAKLRDADLSFANLTGADLTRADLTRADLRFADLTRANLTGADLTRANLDFSQLNLSCKGLNFTIDERIAKQIAYHLINLMQYSKIAMPDNLVEWANTSHLITIHELPLLKGRGDENDNDL